MKELNPELQSTGVAPERRGKSNNFVWGLRSLTLASLVVEAAAINHKNVDARPEAWPRTPTPTRTQPLPPTETRTPVPPTATETQRPPTATRTDTATAKPPTATASETEIPASDTPEPSKTLVPSKTPTIPVKTYVFPSRTPTGWPIESPTPTLSLTEPFEDTETFTPTGTPVLTISATPSPDPTATPSETAPAVVVTTTPRSDVPEGTPQITGAAPKEWKSLPVWVAACISMAFATASGYVTSSFIRWLRKHKR